MMLAEKIFAQAILLAGTLEENRQELLRCTAAASLTARLKEGLTPEDCETVLVQAGSLYALADLEESGGSAGISEFKAGDLTIRQSDSQTGTVSRIYRETAQQMAGPYLKDGFAFLGV